MPARWSQGILAILGLLLVLWGGFAIQSCRKASVSGAARQKADQEQLVTVAEKAKGELHDQDALKLVPRVGEAD
jgi:hypothetical protein